MYVLYEYQQHQLADIGPKHDPFPGESRENGSYWYDVLSVFGKYKQYNVCTYLLDIKCTKFIKLKIRTESQLCGWCGAAEQD